MGWSQPNFPSQVIAEIPFSEHWRSTRDVLLRGRKAENYEFYDRCAPGADTFRGTLWEAIETVDFPIENGDFP